ncbi:MAG: excinuclease ABC subunit UvrC [Chitinispirillaceae bacterium]|nr:excinuclease ABC subunit UvrC [Chitinispirillaceae bacterium]
MNPSHAAFLSQAAKFPESPGVYIMRNAAGVPMYIGKAANLRTRVRSYFMDSHDDRPQIPIMLGQLASMDWIATNTDSEALILEANLIRRHHPKYNIDLRDDKHYPYLKVTLQEPFPRLCVVRRVDKDGARYFGPYTDAAAMRRLVSFSRRIFKLCDCTLRLPLKKNVRPCINYSMGRCSGPCAGHISREEYNARIQDLVRFLSGRRNTLLADLKTRMERASDRLRFEEAALCRDQIALIRDASRLQQVDLKIPDADCDAFGIAALPRQVCIAVLRFREGLLMATSRYMVARKIWDMEQAGHDTAVCQVYLKSGHDVPSEILLPDNAGFDAAALRQWFEARSQTAAVLVPQRGTKKRLVAMAEKNARLYLVQKTPADPGRDCADLQQALRLPTVPRVIEAFDISNLGGSFCVAGMARFVDGVPDKSGYRRFKIKTVAGQNDVAMIMEAVSRRLTRLEHERTPFPDLVLIDGGKGQLHAAMKALARFAQAPAIAALAKKEETLHSPFINEPLVLPQTHPARRLVERVRDEVHRYAIAYHRNRRGKQFTRSAVEELPGIGPRKAALLLKTFGSLQRIRAAMPEEIARVRGMTLAAAIKLKENLDKQVGLS